MAESRLFEYVPFRSRLRNDRRIAGTGPQWKELALGPGTLVEISRRKRPHQSGVPLLDLTGREKRLRLALWWTYEADFLPARAGLVDIIRGVPQFVALLQLKAISPASLGGTFGGIVLREKTI
jgi:hypothetical protein